MTRLQRVHAAAVAMLLAAGAISVARLHPAAGRTQAARKPVDMPALEGGNPLPPAAKQPAATTPAVPGHSFPRGLLSTNDESGAATIQTAPSSSSTFSGRYAAQWYATYDPSIPATNYWALLIGIDDYAGSTRDNVGSYEDARDLRSYLLHLGWHSDHIVLIANRDATASRIVQGIRWLASKTNSDSTVVFHYAGHEKPVHSSADGDNESQDVAIWASDNKLLLDGVLGRELGRVNAAKMWIDLAVCRAGGFSDAGMIAPGRVLTFSSPQSELSYEDPKVHHSVFGWYVIIEGMQEGLGDANGDGDVTVEEAFSYAHDYVVYRTGGRQHPLMTDRYSGNLSLIPPAPPPPPPEPTPGGGGGGCGFIICTGPKP
jgi:hypothetical protein